MLPFRESRPSRSFFRAPRWHTASGSSRYPFMRSPPSNPSIYPSICLSLSLSIYLSIHLSSPRLHAAELCAQLDGAPDRPALGEDQWLEQADKSIKLMIMITMIMAIIIMIILIMMIVVRVIMTVVIIIVM